MGDCQGHSEAPFYGNAEILKHSLELLSLIDLPWYPALIHLVYFIQRTWVLVKTRIRNPSLIQHYRNLLLV